jgi:hypothetical protein
MFGSDRYDRLVGQRVLAIHTINNDHQFVQKFGYGTFLGMFYPYQALGATADAVRAEGDDALNPKIELDTGEIIWGCECWWMSAQKGDLWLMEMAAAGYDIQDVSISEFREAYEKEVMNNG